MLFTYTEEYFEVEQKSWLKRPQAVRTCTKQNGRMVSHCSGLQHLISIVGIFSFDFKITWLWCWCQQTKPMVNGSKRVHCWFSQNLHSKCYTRPIQGNWTDTYSRRFWGVDTVVPVPCTVDTGAPKPAYLGSEPLKYRRRWVSLRERPTWCVLLLWKQHSVVGKTNWNQFQSTRCHCTLIRLGMCERSRAEGWLPSQKKRSRQHTGTECKQWHQQAGWVMKASELHCVFAVQKSDHEFWKKKKNIVKEYGCILESPLGSSKICCCYDLILYSLLTLSTYAGIRQGITWERWVGE